MSATQVLFAIAVAASFLGHAAGADPASTHLVMKQVDGTNLHIADEGGAIHWDEDLTITVDLHADKTVASNAVGMRSEHNLYSGDSSRSTDDTITWTTKWTGTWSRAGVKLVLDLTLADQTCKHEEKMTEFDGARGLWVNYAPEVKPCIAAGKRARLSCSTETLDVQNQAMTKTQKVEAWMCSPTDPDVLGNSPTTWMLGKASCIQIGVGHMHAQSYSACVQ